jgi:ABC-2 type transport system ATP-binding protein
VDAVHAIGITKAFDGTRALDGVDLDVAAEEVRGLLGPNGAGKTTLLRILLGLVHPDAGMVTLFGRKAPAGPCELVAGFVEEPSFYPYLSGRANLRLVARVSGYSTGRRQRLRIAAALLRAPRVLLLDEPTSGLDPAGIQDVRALLAELSRDGLAIVLSSHQISEVEDVCPSFTFLRHGRAVWSGSTGRLRAEAPAGQYVPSTSDDTRAAALAAEAPGIHVTSRTPALAFTAGPDCPASAPLLEPPIAFSKLCTAPAKRSVVADSREAGGAGDRDRQRGIGNRFVALPRRSRENELTVTVTTYCPSSA